MIKNHTRMMENTWSVFCGESACYGSNLGGGRWCESLFFLMATSSSCPNHVMSTCFDLFILVILLCDSIRLRTKKTQHSSSSTGKSLSVLQVASATMNGVLGLVNLCLAVLILEKNFKAMGSLIPFHLWMPFLFHGFTLLLVGVRLSLPVTGHGTWFLVLVFFIFSSIDCISAIFTIIIKNESSFEASLDIFSFIGALLFIVCAFKHYNHLNGDHIMEEKSQYTVIPDKESGDGVTPFENSGFFGRILFWWLTPLMDKGMKKSLEDVDVPKLCVDDRAEICFLQFMEKISTQKRGKQVTHASILDSIISCYRNDILMSGFFALLKVLCLSAGPLLLNAFIKVADGRADFKYEGFLLAISLFFSKGIESLSQRQLYFRSRIIGLKVRSLLTAVIYRKQLRLSNSARITHSSGEIMNYVTVDAYRIGEFPFWFHQIWTTVLQLCIALVLLFQAVRAATFAAMVVIIVTVLCNMPLAKLQHKFQSGLMVAQDERLKACSEALLNMKVLKLYAWESHFKRMIEKLREVEYTWLSAVQLRKAYNSFLFWSSPVLVSAAAFGACYFLGIPLNAGNVFTFVATLRLLQDPIRTIPDVIGVFIQAKVSFSRIVMFLEAGELQNKNKCGMESSSFSVVIDCADFSWEEYFLKSSLRNICLEVGRGEKVAICGEVGSGKSALLAAILGEVPILHGNINVSGSIAYVPQTVWIQTGTIQENIVFGSLMDENRYRKTLEQCSLEKDIDLLPYGDLTEIGERGVNLSGGQKQRIQLARALYRDADIYLLDDPFSAVDAHTATNLFNDYVMGALSSKTVLLVTHQVDFLHAFHSVVLMADGEVLKAAPYEELLRSRQEFRNLVNAHLETAGSERLVEISSKGWMKGSPTTEIKAARIEKKPEPPPEEQLIKQEEREAGDTGLKPYLLYLRQNRGLLYFSLVAASHLIFVSGQIVQNSWMAANVGNPEVSMPRLILVYLLIGCVSTLFLLSRSFLTVVLGMTASRELFSGLLGSLFRAPMSFYDSTPLGRIFSRISSDLSIVDLDVPFSFVFSVGSTMNTYSNLGVLAVISWQVLCVSVPMIFLAIRLQKCYFATAKDLMRINGTTKSMLANHLAESVAGSVSIRAFKDEERFSQKNFDLVDANASAFFHNFAATEWLIQRLEILSAVVLSSSAFCMAFLPTGSFAPGFIGMALSYGLSLNISLVMSIQNQCTLANYIISVERIDQHMHIPSEAPEVIEDARPPLGWPSIGEVVIQNLQIRYMAEGPLVLCGISCRFEGGEKIGIVGRTGSGKTTLISALFRLVEPCGGSITIDGVDISKIGLHDLRSRLGIIPQDPTLFNGTVRYNLDPLFQHTDHDIWEALERCQLRDAVEEKGGGLDYLVAEDGSNWSMGQRQLFCLGRALLKRSRVLVLDEATASVDNATDLILQKAIRSYFSKCTVVTVAHRIPTVMDCTNVLSLRDGVLVEFDEPMKLMKEEGSLFGRLVKEYWSHSRVLHSL